MAFLRSIAFRASFWFFSAIIVFWAALPNTVLAKEDAFSKEDLSQNLPAEIPVINLSSLNSSKPLRDIGNCRWTKAAGTFTLQNICPYTFKNDTLVTVNYTASEDTYGFSIAGASSGTLRRGESRTFYIAINSAANFIPPGQSRSGTATFKFTGFLYSRTDTMDLRITANYWPGDNITNATDMGSGFGTLFGGFANTYYSTQSGERSHFPSSTPNNVRSRWFKWKAPSTGQVTFSTDGSTANDTVLSVYRPRSILGLPSVSSLVQIVSDDNSGAGNDSRVYFHAISGRIYYFAIAAKNTAAATGSYRLRGQKLNDGGDGLLASVLPVARSVQTGKAATAFATIINTSTTTATNCNIQSSGSSSTFPPRNFSYQRVNSANVPVGEVNLPVTIGPGRAQGFVLAVTPYSSTGIRSYRLPLVFDCSNKKPVTSKADLNTLSVASSSAIPVDMVSIAATAGRNGIVEVPGRTGTGAFAAATVNNNGPSRVIRATADFGGASVPAVLSVCRTNPSTGICDNTPSTNVFWNAVTNTTYTFTVFVKGTGNIPFDPANKRVFLRFYEGAVLRGATSVAVRTR